MVRFLDAGAVSENGSEVASERLSSSVCNAIVTTITARVRGSRHIQMGVIGANCDDEAQEETESRRTNSDDDGTGANDVPAAAAQKRHRVNKLHEAMRRIADLEARLQVTVSDDVENFVHCKTVTC